MICISTFGVVVEIISANEGETGPGLGRKDGQEAQMSTYMERSERWLREKRKREVAGRGEARLGQSKVDHPEARVTYYEQLTTTLSRYASSLPRVLKSTRTR